MAFAAEDLTMGQMNAIVKKLGGKEGALRFLRGETSIAPTFPTWKTVTLGKYDLGSQYRQALLERGIEIDYSPERSMDMDCIHFLGEKKTLRLVKATASDLGFLLRPTLNELHKIAYQLGLVHCPIEAVLAFAMEHTSELSLVPTAFVQDHSNDEYAYCIDASIFEDKLMFTINDDSGSMFLQPREFVFCRPQ